MVSVTDKVCGLDTCPEAVYTCTLRMRISIFAFLDPMPQTQPPALSHPSISFTSIYQNMSEK